MNVDRIQTFEDKGTDRASERASGKGTSFPDLMDAVLGRGAEARGLAPRAGDAARDAATPVRADARAGDASDRTLERKSVAKADERRLRGAGERSERAKGSIDPSRKERSDSTSSAPEASESSEVESRAAADASETADRQRGSDDAKAADDAAGSAEQLAACGLAPVAVDASKAMAVPELDGLAAGGEIDVEATSGEGDAAVGEPGIGAGFDALARAASGDSEADRAGAVSARAPIVEASAREAAQAALEAAAAGKATNGSDAEGAEATAAEIASESQATHADAAVERAAGDPAEALGLRSQAAAEERLRAAARAARGEEGVDGAGRAGELAARAAQTRASTGTERAQPGVPLDATNAALASGERASAEGAAADAPTPSMANGIGTALPGAADASVETRSLDAAALPAPGRSAEGATAVPTGRALPSPAPEAIAIQADWLASRGGGTARLVLNPPDLGEIMIRVTVRQQSVDVVMVAHTALAHAMAEDQSERLGQAFASRDLRLDQFEVRRADPTDDASASGQFGSSDAGARERDRAADEQGVERGFGGRSGRGRGAANGSAAPAASARVGSDGRNAGVDLRI